MGNDCCKSKKGAEIEKFKAERTAAGFEDKTPTAASTPAKATPSAKVGSVTTDDDRLEELYTALEEEF